MANERLKNIALVESKFPCYSLIYLELRRENYPRKNAPNNIHPIGGATHGIVTGGCITNT
jgi:hypothetical protein